MVAVAAAACRCLLPAQTCCSSGAASASAGASFVSSECNLLQERPAAAIFDECKSHEKIAVLNSAIGSQQTHWHSAMFSFLPTPPTSSFDLSSDYATPYEAARSAYLADAQALKEATGPYKAARDAYVAATATYTKSLYE
jgi:hypothetical protein